MLKKLNLHHIPVKIHKFAAMNLAIDVGNTLAKAALFERNLLKTHIDSFDEQSLRAVFAQEKIENIIVSTVSPRAEDLLKLIPANIPIFRLAHDKPLPIQHLYQTPATLGMDRVAAVTGATVLCPFANRLVIDAGTCITYDFIDSTNLYHGGSISLGLQMRFRALHEFTAKLPLFSKENFSGEASFIGNSTETSMVSGVVYGLISEIEGFILKYQQKFGALQVVFCGGDAPFLWTKLKNEKWENEKTTIAYQKDLLFIGLNHILLYNLKTNQAI